MPRTRGLQALTFPLLMLVLFNMIPSLYWRPFWSTGLVAVFLGYRFFLEITGLPLPPRWTIWIGQAVVGTAIWQHYHSIFGDESAGTLLTLLTCLKTYELRTKRDYFFNSLLCFLVLMSYLLMDQSLILTFYVVADVILIVSFLYALESETFNWKSVKGYLRPTFGLAIKAVPLLVICFILFPRFSTGFGTGQNVQTKTGITDSLKPGSVADLIPSDELVFRATFLNGEMPPKTSLYWRGAVLDVSKGLDWERSDERDKKRPPVASGIKQDIEIYLEPGFEKFMFALDNTRTVSIPADLNRARINYRDGRVFELDQPLQNRERYILEMAEPQNIPESEESLKRFLKTGEQPSAEMRQFLGKIRGQSDSETMANLLNNFRSNGYVYTMQPGPAKNIDEFMFKSKAGFCEHYAGSMATMLRQLGIPSRVVVGFQGGTPSFLENYITVRGHDAHAWVEYYDRSSQRWRRVDPTAQVAPLRLSLGSESYLQQSQQWLGWLGDQKNAYFKVRAMVDEIEARWIGFLLRFDLAAQKELLAKFGMEETIFRALPVFLMLALVLVLAVLYFLEAQRREHLNPEERLYRDLLKALRRWKIEKQPHEGPLTLMDKVRARHPQLAERVAPLLETLILARFAGHVLSAPERERLHLQLRAIRKLSIN